MNWIYVPIGPISGADEMTCLAPLNLVGAKTLRGEATNGASLAAMLKSFAAAGGMTSANENKFAARLNVTGGDFALMTAPAAWRGVASGAFRGVMFGISKSRSGSEIEVSQLVDRAFDDVDLAQIDKSVVPESTNYFAKREGEVGKANLGFALALDKAHSRPRTMDELYRSPRDLANLRIRKALGEDERQREVETVPRMDSLGSATDDREARRHAAVIKDSLGKLGKCLAKAVAERPGDENLKTAAAHHALMAYHVEKLLGGDENYGDVGAMESIERPVERVAAANDPLGFQKSLASRIRSGRALRIGGLS